MSPEYELPLIDSNKIDTSSIKLGSTIFHYDLIPKYVRLWWKIRKLLGFPKKHPYRKIIEFKAGEVPVTKIAVEVKNEK